jgi:3-phenylpropionate/trans-cinnamate dioxygenase ferredoxin subunit
MALLFAATIDELTDGDSKQIPHDPPLALFRSAGEYFVTQEFCTHEDASMIDGWVADDCTIECPWHSAKFCLRTGDALTPPASQPLKIYPVVIEGDRIYVDLAGEG